jgi:hypothetical protein
MPKKKELRLRWHEDVEDHNYPAAESYLSLIFTAKTAAALVAGLRAAPAAQFMAKDIFRASGLALAGISKSRLETDRRKIAAGKMLSPILLVRDEMNGKVIVADGYHRLCAVHSFDDEAWIPCKIIDRAGR